jgi:hypothetical protein
VDVATTAGDQLAVTVAKRPLFASKLLTHIQAAAAAPNGRFLVVQRHENHDLLRVDLPSGKTTVLATRCRYPNLDYYNVIVWQRHESEGHGSESSRDAIAWSRTRGRSSCGTPSSTARRS